MRDRPFPVPHSARHTHLREVGHLSPAAGPRVRACARALGQERNAAIAVFRRVWQLIPFIGEIPIPFVFHFDFTDPSGRLMMASTRRYSLRDRYVITVPDGALDGRVAAAMAVALDALQSR